ncbi:hypothetical protein PT974_06923 [Cladobotryum mycophilum]|uniref:Hydrophobin n=1 Tax=Cladobotryum mycophilum TaxID=491253 RepID=A0ABR0SMT8_9HYPO
MYAIGSVILALAALATAVPTASSIDGRSLLNSDCISGLEFYCNSETVNRDITDYDLTVYCHPTITVNPPEPDDPSLQACCLKGLDSGLNDMELGAALKKAFLSPTACVNQNLASRGHRSE